MRSHEDVGLAGLGALGDVPVAEGARVPHDAVLAGGAVGAAVHGLAVVARHQAVHAVDAARELVGLLVDAGDLDAARRGAVDERGLAAGVEEALLVEVVLLRVVVLIAVGVVGVVTAQQGEGTGVWASVSGGPGAGPAVPGMQLLPHA